MTTNGWDSDATAGPPAGSESAGAGSTTPQAWDPEAWDSASGQYAPGPPSELIPRLQVPGMAAWSPARDYMVGEQRRRMRHRAAVASAILAVGVVVAVVTVAGHSGGAKNGSAQLTAAQIVQQAVRQQNGLHSESATFSERVSGQLNETVTGTVELQRKPLLMAMNMSVTGGSQAARMRAILTGSAMYVKLHGAASLPSYLTAKWLKIPLTGLSPASVFAVLQHDLQNENPSSQFAGLKAASHLHATGTQIINGVTTTKYNGSFTPSAAVKALPAAQRSALGPYLNLIKGDVSFSVWIDSSHYVRKIQQTESLDGATIFLEGTYGSFNQPVSIALPPPSRVYSPPASALDD